MASGTRRSWTRASKTVSQSCGCSSSGAALAAAPGGRAASAQAWNTSTGVLALASRCRKGGLEAQTLQLGKEALPSPHWPDGCSPPSREHARRAAGVQRRRRRRLHRRAAARECAGVQRHLAAGGLPCAPGVCHHQGSSRCRHRPGLAAQRALGLRSGGGSLRHAPGAQGLRVALWPRLIPSKSEHQDQRTGAVVSPFACIATRPKKVAPPFGIAMAQAHSPPRRRRDSTRSIATSSPHSCGSGRHLAGHPRVARRRWSRGCRRC